MEGNNRRLQSAKKPGFFCLSSGEYLIKFNFTLSHEGVLHREVSCGLNEGDPMEERFCEAVLKPRASKTCRNKQCKGTWKASQWSEVSSIVVILFFNNRMVTVTLAPAAFKVGSKVWVRYLGVIEGHPEGVAIRDGLWRPGGAFFQTGFGCAL